jgi:hypothetical protein
MPVCRRTPSFLRLSSPHVAGLALAHALASEAAAARHIAAAQLASPSPPPPPTHTESHSESLEDAVRGDGESAEEEAAMGTLAIGTGAGDVVALRAWAEALAAREHEVLRRESELASRVTGLLSREHMLAQADEQVHSARCTGAHRC